MNIENFFETGIILENERARLTPLQEEDISQLEKIAFVPGIWELQITQVKERSDLEKWIKTASNEKKNGQSYPFLIFDKEKNKVAGCTRYGNISFPNKRLEIGWTWLHPEFQGTGLNKACKFLLLNFAFETLQLNRVELKTDLLNLQSQKAMKKIGLKQEGIFRKYQLTDSGRIRDTIFYSMINDDWDNIKNTIFKEFTVK